MIDYGDLRALDISNYLELYKFHVSSLGLLDDSEWINIADLIKFVNENILKTEE